MPDVRALNYQERGGISAYRDGKRKLMDLSRLLNGLRPDSSVTPQMLKELTAWHEKLVQRSSTNDNWTEETQKEFQLVQAILRRNEGHAEDAVDSSTSLRS